MADTLTYYSQSAATYFESTVGLDLTPIYTRFLDSLPLGSLILDLGCGSGPDTKHFLANGYRVHAIYAGRNAQERKAGPRLVQTANHKSQCAGHH